MLAAARSLLLAAAAAASAAVPPVPALQQSVLRPGMSETEVRGLWGEPGAVRRAGEWTFLFYPNGIEAAVGWQDVVFLQGGQVVNAIVRGPGRGYAGQSSAPPGSVPEPTIREIPNPNVPGAVTGVRVNP